MRYLDKKFSVASPDSDAYRDGCVYCGGSGQKTLTCAQCLRDEALGFEPYCVAPCEECGGTGQEPSP